MVDDGSKDDTYTIPLKLNAEDSRIKCLKLHRNRGKVNFTTRLKNSDSLELRNFRKALDCEGVLDNCTNLHHLVDGLF